MRWFRVDDGLVDDPKVQQLPDRLFRAVINLWCITSQSGGNLPAVDQISFKLRVSPAKAAEILEELRARGLIEDDETGTRPHNWNARQFKKDVSTERVKKFREQRRNVSETVSSSVSETPPDTETDTETERKKDAATAAPADFDLEKPQPSQPEFERQLFVRGKQVFGKNSGGLIRTLLKAKQGEVALARAAIEQASTKQNPREYAAAVIKGGHASADGRRLTNDEQYYGVGRIPGIV